MAGLHGPRLSVVIPTRNGADHLAEQLDALAEQDLDEDFEVVVADNGSTDATLAIAEGYADRLALRVVDACAAQGVAATRNAGAAAARGSRLVFLDDDDVVAPGYLAAMSAALSNFDFVAAKLDVRRLNPTWRVEMRAAERIEGLRITVDGVLWAPGCVLGVTRRAFDAVDGFDARHEIAGEDVDFCFRMHDAGFVLHLAADALLYRRLRTTRWSIFNQARRYVYGNVVGVHDRRPRSPLSGLPGGLRLVVLGRGRSQRILGIWLLGRATGRLQYLVSPRSPRRAVTARTSAAGEPPREAATGS